MRVKHLAVLLGFLVVGLTGFFVWYYLNEIAPFGSPVASGIARVNYKPKYLFTLRGELPGQPMKEPNDAVIDSRGRIYIADTLQGRILVYNPNGRFLYSFGRQGSKDGEMVYPVGLAISGETLYVSDVQANRVQAYDLKGHYLGTVVNNGGNKLLAISPR